MSANIDRTISQLEVANPLSGNEIFPVTQSGETRRSSIVAILTYLKTQLTTDNIAEGVTNLYFQPDRADARVNIHAARLDNPHQVTKTQLGLSEVLNIKHNLEAINDPGFFDDANSGYTYMSMWFNSTSKKFFICVDPTNGSALWDVVNSNEAGDIGLGNVENVALSTWPGSNNIVTVNQAAVTAHQQALDHNQLINSDTERHINHVEVSILTPTGGGLSGGGNITESRSLEINLENVDAIASFDGEADKLAIWDDDLQLLKTVLPSQIAAMSAFKSMVTLDANYTVQAADRGTLFVINATGITITFDPAEDLDTGFVVAFASPKDYVFTLAANAADKINGMSQQKFGRQPGFLVFADDVNGLYTVGDKPEIIKLEYTVASNTGGGNFANGSFIDRPLNTEVQDTANLCSLASNIITLEPGTYELDAHLNVGGVGFHKAQLWNNTASSEVFMGMTYAGSVPAELNGRFVVTTTTGYKLRHRCTTTVNTSGMGGAAAFGINETHASVIIRRVGGIPLT